MSNPLGICVILKIDREHTNILVFSKTDKGIQKQLPIYGGSEFLQRVMSKLGQKFLSEIFFGFRKMSIYIGTFTYRGTFQIISLWAITLNGTL